MYRQTNVTISGKEFKVKKNVYILLQTKTKQDACMKLKHICMQSGSSQGKHAVGPKHTNTSGDYSTGAMVVVQQMLPRGYTASTHTYTK